MVTRKKKNLIRLGGGEVLGADNRGGAVATKAQEYVYFMGESPPKGKVSVGRRTDGNSRFRNLRSFPKGSVEKSLVKSQRHNGRD